MNACLKRTYQKKEKKKKECLFEKIWVALSNAHLKNYKVSMWFSECPYEGLKWNVILNAILKKVHILQAIGYALYSI